MCEVFDATGIQIRLLVFFDTARKYCFSFGIMCKELNIFLAVFVSDFAQRLIWRFLRLLLSGERPPEKMATTTWLTHSNFLNPSRSRCVAGSGKQLLSNKAETSRWWEMQGVWDRERDMHDAGCGYSASLFQCFTEKENAASGKWEGQNFSWQLWLFSSIFFFQYTDFSKSD